MKKTLLAAALLVNLLFSQSLPTWNGVSVSTSDNLDATNFNPAGLGVNRGSLFGLALRNLKTNADRPYYNIASVSNNFATMLYTDYNGDIHYAFGLGFPISGSKSYLGVQYFTEKVLRSGLLLRPLPYISFGYTNDLYFADEITTNTVGIGLRPFTNRITVGADLKNTIVNEKVDNQLSVFTELRPIDGLNVKAAYDPDMESYNLSIGMDLGNAQAIWGRNDVDKSLSYLSLQTYSQDRKSILDIFKSKKTTENYIEMSLGGIFIEEPTKKGNPFDLKLNVPLIGIDNNSYIQLRKWIEGVDKIANDPNIDGIIIYLKGVGGGFSKLMEAKNALQRCKDNGKKIIVYATGISNSNYYMVSLADEIYINKLSAVDLRGLNFEITFYKELADSLDIVYEVEKISNYKSALDQWTRTSMSDEMKENMGGLLDDIYGEFVSSIAKSRNLSVEETQAIIDDGPYTSKQAVKKNLITKLLYPDQFNEYKKNLNKKKANFIPFTKYTSNNVYVYDWCPEYDKEKIAIIYAVGGINVGNSVRNGRGPSSVMGNATIAKAIASAREDKSIKAIILRIDSGGGSALASDLIWREIEKTTTGDNPKPFIASMSDVAASGGYYIACQADTIIANPTTITGSIGVISGRLNFSGLLEKVGLHTDRMLYGKNASMYSGKKLWTDEERKKINDQMLDIYGEFLSRVADGRNDLDSLAVDKVGIGQVWSGESALDKKLVDVLGGIVKSVDIASKMANISDKKNLQIVEYPQQEKLSMLKTQKENKTTWGLEISLSGQLQELQHTINSLPKFDQDKMQLVIPYKIDIK